MHSEQSIAPFYVFKKKKKTAPRIHMTFPILENTVPRPNEAGVWKPFFILLHAPQGRTHALHWNVSPYLIVLQADEVVE